MAIIMMDINMVCIGSV